MCSAGRRHPDVSPPCARQLSTVEHLGKPSMPTLPTRAAAYTRTGILKRFLEQLSAADPGRVDNAYAELRLGLRGGDVRAFLQSLRVLGLTDPYGQTTERARRL